MPALPRRLRLKDELGVTKTLTSGHETVRTSSSRNWLVLGLGPDPQAMAQGLAPDAVVSYLECPTFFDQAGADWQADIPANWQRVYTFDPLSDQNVLMYQAAMHLFPGFWGPVGAAFALPTPAKRDGSGAKTALIPLVRSRLIASEAAQALQEEGFLVQPVAVNGLVPTLEQSQPEIFLSINFAGLDSYGAAYSLLARAEVPVAVWCVDNPFHSLSGVKSGYWKDVHIFVTDSWFVEPLKRHGARHVHHLPLAANQEFFKATPSRPDLADKLLFVGRSAFPGKSDFFAGLTVQEDAWAEAHTMLARGERPDFGWWAARLGIDSFWPGRQARRAGFAAEESGLAWRSMVIQEASKAGNLAVCGDDDWRKHVDATYTLLPSVDYYGPLASMYASARYVVGATSPLLPHGLTQRHFDVWAAGGCLLTDDTPGLGIFPEELTKPITFKRASDIAVVAKNCGPERDGLIGQWRELIAREHTYAQRIRTILERISP
ncbi:MAG: glycosyltransferase [Desulfovibrio sp.]|nr:glycosyltransferase [Desulfovibrio sp.]MBI4960360.1 glycosyltransferase [Desulfovibrio sp.]